MAESEFAEAMLAKNKVRATNKSVVVFINQGGELIKKNGCFLKIITFSFLNKQVLNIVFLGIVR